MGSIIYLLIGIALVIAGYFLAESDTYNKFLVGIVAFLFAYCCFVYYFQLINNISPALLQQIDRNIYEELRQSAITANLCYAFFLQFCVMIAVKLIK